MATVDERAHLEYALKEIRGSQVWDIPTEGRLDDFNCPLCHTALLTDLSYDEIEKIKNWTVAQLVAWHNLQKRSGVDAHELLERTFGGSHDHIGVNDFHGMYVGIEPDGYTHT